MRTLLLLGGSTLILLAGLREHLQERWQAFIAGRVDAALVPVRERHAADLRAAKAHHDDWCDALLQLHNEAVATLERDAQQRTDAAVADVLARYCRERGAA